MPRRFKLHRLLSSQREEDRLLDDLFKAIGTTNKIAVEFGATDGLHGSNTALFRVKRGWRTILFDTLPLSPKVIKAHITAKNVNEVFHEHGVPQAFDLLSIDIDGQDYWVWKALKYRPRVVVIEFNPKWKRTDARVIPEDPAFLWDKTDYYGASIGALLKLAKRKEYVLVGSTRSNLLFARRGLWPAMSPLRIVRSRKRKRRDPLKRKWVKV